MKKKSARAEPSPAGDQPPICPSCGERDRVIAHPMAPGRPALQDALVPSEEAPIDWWCNRCTGWVAALAPGPLRPRLRRARAGQGRRDRPASGGRLKEHPIADLPGCAGAIAEALARSDIRTAEHVAAIAGDRGWVSLRRDASQWAYTVATQVGRLTPEQAFVLADAVAGLVLAGELEVPAAKPSPTRIRKGRKRSAT